MVLPTVHAALVLRQCAAASVRGSMSAGRGRLRRPDRSARPRHSAPAGRPAYLPRPRIPYTAQPQCCFVLISLTECTHVLRLDSMSLLRPKDVGLLGLDLASRAFMAKHSPSRRAAGEGAPSRAGYTQGKPCQNKSSFSECAPAHRNRALLQQARRGGPGEARQVRQAEHRVQVRLQSGLGVGVCRAPLHAQVSQCASSRAIILARPKMHACCACGGSLACASERQRHAVAYRQGSRIRTRCQMRCPAPPLQRPAAADPATPALRAPQGRACAQVKLHTEALADLQHMGMSTMGSNEA